MNDGGYDSEGAAPDRAAEERLARLLKLAGPRLPVPEERAAQVRERVRIHWRATIGRGRRRRFFLIAAQVAAAAALVMLAEIGLRLHDGRRAARAIGTIERIEGRVLLSDGPADPGRALPASTVLSTGPDGMAAIRLAGGPSIRVGALTHVALTEARALELRSGALYIDTGAAPAAVSSPIEILTRLGRVRDVGTQFTVRLTDDALDVSVREGRATLALEDRTYTAGAGTRLRVAASGAVETRAIAPQGSEWDWVLVVAPPFEMEGRTLRDYLAWLSRETGWRVEFVNPAIADSALDVVLHGSTLGLRPDETPDAVLPACSLKYHREGGTILIENAGDVAPG